MCVQKSMTFVQPACIQQGDACLHCESKQICLICYWQNSLVVECMCRAVIIIHVTYIAGMQSVLAKAHNIQTC